MNRRRFIQALGAAAFYRQPHVTRKLRQGPKRRPVKIRDVRVIACQPGGARLTAVKILTDQHGLYGYGCATSAEYADLLVLAIQKYLRPSILGKPVDPIEDLWQAM